MSTLFRSKLHPGLVMNRYGIVLDGLLVMADGLNGEVKREALAAGWTRQRGLDYEDVGFTWVPPDASAAASPDWPGELESAHRTQADLMKRMSAGGATFVATQMEYTLRCLEMEIEDCRGGR
jgi:hypothetical protein